MTGLPRSGAARLARLPRPARAGLVLAVVAALVAACGGAAQLAPIDSSDADGGMPVQAPEVEAPAANEDSTWRTLAGDGTSYARVDDVLIVRTGRLDLQVDALDDALAAADAAVSAAGGYVAASERAGDGERASATVTYRVPVDRWESTLTALREVGTKVVAEQTSSEEVTSQVVDLGARLDNLRATEAALQAIMAKATRIPDVLEVQAQLTSVREEIERLTAQKQALEERAALATLVVSFSPPPVVAVTQVQEGWDPAAEVDRATATLVGLGQGLASAAIWVGIVVLPLLLLVAAGAAVAWVAARRARRRPPTGPEPGPESGAGSGPGSGPEPAADVPAA